MALERWLRTSLLTASLASAQTPAAPEPPKFAHVSGVVLDERDDRLLRRAVVCLHRGAVSGYSDSSTAHCDETDAQGRFNIANPLLPDTRILSNAKDIFQASPPPTVCRP
jgi:hypothetical protein